MKLPFVWRHELETVIAQRDLAERTMAREQSLSQGDNQRAHLATQREADTRRELAQAEARLNAAAQHIVLLRDYLDDARAREALLMDRLVPKTIVPAPPLMPSDPDTITLNRVRDETHERMAEHFVKTAGMAVEQANQLAKELLAEADRQESAYPSDVI